jgi:hypothetical protein
MSMSNFEIGDEVYLYRKPRSYEVKHLRLPIDEENIELDAGSPGEIVAVHPCSEYTVLFGKQYNDPYLAKIPKYMLNKSKEDDDISIENQFFTWEDWDLVEPGVFIFYNVQLTRDMEGFEAGRMFSHAVLDSQRSLIELVAKNSDKITGDSMQSIIFRLKANVELLMIKSWNEYE